MPVTTITSADGTTLAARHSGHGSPMVLVHGTNGDLDTFALIEGLLAERHSVWSMTCWPSSPPLATAPPELLPKAQLHGLPGQRHVAFAFDPTSVAQAVLHFTKAHDG